MIVIQNITKNPPEKLIFRSLKLSKEDPDFVLQPNTMVDLSSIEDKVKNNAEIRFYQAEKKIAVLNELPNDKTPESINNDNRKNQADSELQRKLMEIASTNSITDLEDYIENDPNPEVINSAMKRMISLGGSPDKAPELQE